MGNPRSMFRPDLLPERAILRWYHLMNCQSSSNNRCIKREHNKRQRQYNATTVIAGLLDWENGHAS